MLYFASGHLDLPGAMFTASHNPARYNGIKLCRAGAVAIGQDTGLAEISDRAAGATSTTAPAGRRRRGRDRPTTGRPAGRLRRLPALAGRPDARSGRCGWSSTPPTAWAATPCRPCSATRCSPRCRSTIVPLYFELDGSFPNHEANPLEPANLVDLQKAVVAERRRHRAGLRRRRRPLLRHRRRRRAGLAERDHRADRRPRAGPQSRARRSSTT